MAGNKNSGHRLDKERMLLASLSREHTEAALKKILDLMYSAENESVQLGAANAILDRGWGKPFQAVAIDTSEEAKKIIYGWLPTQN